MTLASDDKVLILFRHAKAEQVLGKPDHERELTGRGLRDARAAGAWLHEHELGPELVLCSSATRTRQTWSAAAEGGACGETVEFTDSIYSGGAETVLQSLRESAGEAQVVMVVGHNPTMAMLASGLSEGDGSTRRARVPGRGLPDVLAWRCCATPGRGRDSTFGTAALERCHISRG